MTIKGSSLPSLWHNLSLAEGLVWPARHLHAPPEEASPSPKRPDFSRPPRDDESLKSQGRRKVGEGGRASHGRMRDTGRGEKQVMEEEEAEAADEQYVATTYRQHPR